MNTPNDALVHALTTSARLVTMYAGDLTPADMLHRLCPTANCAAWTMGHIILSGRRMGIAAGVAEAELPKLPDGFEKRFGRGDNAPAADDFGDTKALLPLFTATSDALISWAKAATPAKLAEPREGPMGLFKDVAGLLSFCAQHQTMHAGQLTMVRRSLGKPPVV